MNYVATRTFWADYWGRRELIVKGRHRIHGEHELVSRFPGCFAAEGDAESLGERPRRSRSRGDFIAWLSGRR